MTLDIWLILGCWIVFVVYWALAAVGAKRNIGARAWWREAGLRLAVLVLIVLLLRIPGLEGVLRRLHVEMSSSAGVTGAAGVALCALGIGLAIWARTHLGRNWGVPMSRKEDPELVTTGPYAVLRHPIYAGILVAMLGSALGTSLIWLPLIVFFAAYFVYSARSEEKLLAEQFPDQYPAYRERTKMLLPFVI